MTEFPNYTGIKPDAQLIPEYMRPGLRRYIEYGIEPGSFLSAVLCNDLKAACERADNVNCHRLYQYVKFLYCFAPDQCWGSTARFATWVKQGGLAGHDQVERKRAADRIDGYDRDDLGESPDF